MNIMYVAIKDLKQHARVYLLYIASAVLFPISLLLINSYTPHRIFDPMIESRSLFGISLTVTTFAPLLLGHLLISVEKSKRTMLTLILLPVKREAIILCKEAVAALLLILIYILNTIATTLSFRLIRGIWGYAPSLGMLITVAMALITFTQFSMLLFIRFQQRIAYQIPFILIMIGRPLWLLYEEYFHVGAERIVEISTFSSWALFAILMVTLHYILNKSFIDHDWSVETVD